MSSILPIDTINVVFRYLAPGPLRAASQVCSTWKSEIEKSELYPQATSQEAKTYLYVLEILQNPCLLFRRTLIHRHVISRAVLAFPHPLLISSFYRGGRTVMQTREMAPHSLSAIKSHYIAFNNPISTLAAMNHPGTYVAANQCGTIKVFHTEIESPLFSFHQKAQVSCLVAYGKNGFIAGNVRGEINLYHTQPINITMLGSSSPGHIKALVVAGNTLFSLSAHSTLASWDLSSPGTFQTLPKPNSTRSFLQSKLRGLCLFQNHLITFCANTIASMPLSKDIKSWHSYSFGKRQCVDIQTYAEHLVVVGTEGHSTHLYFFSELSSPKRVLPLNSLLPPEKLICCSGSSLFYIQTQNEMQCWQFASLPP